MAEDRHTDDQHTTVLFGLYAKTEGAWERYFPEFKRLRRAHRTIVMMVAQAVVVGNPYTVERLERVVREQLLLSDNIASERIKDLLEEGLIEKVRSASDGRVRLVVLTGRARAALSDVSEVVVREMRFLADLLPTRGLLPPLAQPAGGFFDPLAAIVAADSLTSEKVV